MHKYILIFILLNSSLIFCQDDSLCREFAVTLSKINTLSFTASVHTEDTKYGIRDFKTFQVFAKRNPNNIAYNFDWHISEVEGSKFVQIYLGQDFYLISNAHEKVTLKANAGKLEQNQYWSDVRQNTLVDELIYDLKKLYSVSSINFKVQSNGTNLKRAKIKIDEYTDRDIYFDAYTLLPIKIIEQTKSDVTNDFKTIKINLEHIKTNFTMSDTILNPQFYLDKNFAFVKESDSIENRIIEFEKNLSHEKLSEFLLADMVDSAGYTTCITQNDAKLYIIEFWFLGCKPCMQSMPFLQELSNKYKNEGLEVIGVNGSNFEGRINAINMLTRNEIYYTNLFSHRSVIDELKLFIFPTFLILDENLNLIYSEYGTDDDSKKKMSVFVKNYFAGDK